MNSHRSLPRSLRLLTLPALLCAPLCSCTEHVYPHSESTVYQSTPSRPTSRVSTYRPSASAPAARVTPYVPESVEAVHAE
ncbi:MAG: hypothetical protein JWL81_316 [Verrucomicrobiales bacterium]|nr:hypothetical protein [Verrucomicrobiales bacterium]